VWLSLAERLRTPPGPPPALSFGSLIVSDFPEIFAEFREKRLLLLWRGSRDGFRARDFHGHCDGHANTLTVILDTNGNVFGGFAPMAWESRFYDDNQMGMNCWKADDSMRSFVFTLKNPCNIPARTFALKAEKKLEAIYCGSGWGPCFGDILLRDTCNANASSFTYLGFAYTNDTGLDGMTVFTGCYKFQTNPTNNEGNRSLRNHRINNSSKQIPLVGEGEIA
jgi:hypothetical protein